MEIIGARGDTWMTGERSISIDLLAAIMVWIVKSRVPRDQPKDDVAADVPKPSGTTRPPLQIRLAATTATTIKVITAFVMGLLAAGAISSDLAFSYPAPGRSVSVFFEGANQNGSLELYCIGETIPSRPTVFLVATSAHGIVDFYGIQHYLNSLNGTNRRVCSYDNLGFGWSQDPFKGQYTNYEFLHSLMLSSGEPAPWHIIGWGGGGSALAALAKNHTSSVKSLSFVETYPPGIEFEYYGRLNNLDSNATASYRASQLSSRMGLAKLILYLAIPWGLMSVVVPISPQNPGYFPPDRWREFKMQMWKSPSWISQYQGLQHLQETPDAADPLIANAPLPSSLPVLGVYCNVTSTCFNGFQNLTGKACSDLIQQNQFYNEKKFSLLKSLSLNASLVTRNSYDCSLNLPVDQPEFTARSILSFYGLD